MTKEVISFHSIPAEIWEAIFDKLSLKNRFTCQYMCKAWYVPAKRSFLEHVTLQTVYDVEQFLECFLNYAEPFSFGFIRKLTIGHSYTMPRRSRLHLKSEAVSKLIHHFPNIQQLEISDNCIDLTYFTKPETISAMISHWPLLHSFRVNRVLIQAEKRQIYLETVHQLRHCMTKLALYKMDSPALFVASFPQLQHLNILPQDDMENMQDCLAILEHAQPLESLSVFTKQSDSESFFERYQQSRSTHHQHALNHRLAAIKTLTLTTNAFCINTMRFITQSMTGLSSLTMGFVSNNVDRWTLDQRHCFKNEFLDFLCQRRNYLILRIKFNYNHENYHDTCAIVDKHFNLQNTVHTQTMDRRLHLVCFNNHLEFGSIYNNTLASESKYSLELKSDDIGRKVLRRTATLTHLYEKTCSEDILKALSYILSIKSINNLIFDMSNICILAEEMTGLFAKVLKHLPQVNAITVHVPRNYQQLNLFIDDSFTYEQVDTLEIKSNSLDPLNKDMLYCASIIFPRLKYVSLWTPSGHWLLTENKFIVDMRMASLQHLHLDMTSVRVKVLNQRMQRSLKDTFFVLQVNDEKKELYYRVSCDYLQITRLEKPDLTALSAVDDEYITMLLTFKRLDFLTMYLHEKVFHEVDPLFTGLNKRKMIQSSLLFSDL
jgi:hypothetical protein